jgi:hypothetical protein
MTIIWLGRKSVLLDRRKEGSVSLIFSYLDGYSLTAESTFDGFPEGLTFDPVPDIPLAVLCANARRHFFGADLRRRIILLWSVQLTSRERPGLSAIASLIAGFPGPLLTRGFL